MSGHCCDDHHQPLTWSLAPTVRAFEGVPPRRGPSSSAPAASLPWSEEKGRTARKRSTRLRRCWLLLFAVIAVDVADAAGQHAKRAGGR